MVHRERTTKKKKAPMTSSKIPGHLQLHQVTVRPPKSAPCTAMLCLLPILFPPPATRSLFKVPIEDVPHIALCFQARLMGLVRKEMHLLQPWKTSTHSMQLLSIYKRLPPL